MEETGSSFKAFDAIAFSSLGQKRTFGCLIPLPVGAIARSMSMRTVELIRCVSSLHSTYLEYGKEDVMTSEASQGGNLAAMAF